MLASIQQRKSASTAKGNEAAVPKVPAALPDSPAGFWLDAHYDPVANLKAFSTCLHTCDLYGDGDWRLAVAGLEKKLKVWKGTQMASEHTLVDIPSAATSFYADVQTPRIPALAVSVGPNVFIYRNLRPYFKFTLPPETVSDVEKTVWQQLYAGSLSLAQARQTLHKLSTGSTPVTSCTTELQDLNEAGQEADLDMLSKQYKGEPPVQQTIITCMTTVKKAYDEDDAVSCLVLGTESGQVMVLSPTANMVTHHWQLRQHVPAFLCASGLLDVEHRVAIATRHGKVVLMKNGAVTSTIHLDALPLGIARSHKGFLVGCTNSTVQYFNLKGKRSFCVNLPSPILAMHGLETAQQKISKCLVVSLANGLFLVVGDPLHRARPPTPHPPRSLTTTPYTSPLPSRYVCESTFSAGDLRVYNEQHLVSVTKFESPVNAMTFGKFGREENTLVSITRTGGLDVKILPRTAKLDGGSSVTGPPPEQDIPLDIPKRTAVYIQQVTTSDTTSQCVSAEIEQVPVASQYIAHHTEQTEREKANAVDIHNTFQQELVQLRLATAKAYMKVMTDGQGATSTSTASSASLTLNATVSGLGPAFKLTLELCNNGSQPILGAALVLLYNKQMYSAQHDQRQLPVLLPALQYHFDIRIHCLDPEAGVDVVKILMHSSKSAVPLLSALVKMPLSEFEEE
ncbi:TPA: Bardet-Biedl syndrome 1 protein [Trebouxia sp. C0004]